MRMKKLYTILLVVILMVTSFNFSAFAAETGQPTAQAPDGSSIAISGANRTIAAADEMILFTRDNASGQTDTNPYTAAAVADYMDGNYVITAVTARTGAIDIPVNGFVLFGHGTSEQWILEHLHAGDEVAIQGATLPEPITGAQLQLENGAKIPIDLIDLERESEKIAIYTSQYGNATKPFSNDTAEYIVVNDVVAAKQTDGTKGTYIPANGYVVSASGSVKLQLESLETGQIVRPLNVEIPVLPAKYLTIRGTTVPIDDINGSRDANEVVLYQPNFSLVTMTNEWGLELTVIDSKVTKIVGITQDPNDPTRYLPNNSDIPSNGYVVSIQAGSPYYGQLNGTAAVGDTVQVMLNNGSLYQASKNLFDAYNPKTREDNPAGWDDLSNQPFPGLRGANQLIIYDESYGAATGTNPWGSEVIVNSDGKVISNGGNNSAIPQGGYVLSGHGSKAAWLVNNAQIGSTVIIERNTKTVLLLFTPQSYLDKAQISIDAIEKGLAQSKSMFMDVPYEEIRQKINEAKQVYIEAEAHYTRGGIDGLFEILNRLDALVTDARYMNYESRKVENRGLWLRPKETSLAEVRDHLLKIKNLNINSIYLETWWDGYTIFPTDNPLTELNPIYNGFNVLQAYLEEGKKLDIDIHAWVENFFVGGNKPGPVLLKHPEWTIMSRQGEPYEFDRVNNFKYYFINPALPEARDFVSSVYKELLSNYDVAGLHLDYTRYPGSGDYSNDFGYETYTRGLFKEKYNADPLELHPGDDLWEQWLQFRTDIINTWVDRIVEEAREIKPGVSITAAVWPNYESAPALMGQEAKHWVEKSYIDNLFHMSYVPDAFLLVADAEKSIAIANHKSLVTSGVGTFNGLSKEELIHQIDSVNRMPVSGSAIFEFESLFSVGYDKLLKLGLYRNPAMVPNFNKMDSYKAILDEMIRKINSIYVPFGGMSEKTADKFSKELNKAVQALNSEKITSDGKKTKIKELGDNIGKLVKTMEKDETLNIEVKNRLLADLKLASDMINVYSSRIDQ
jgi:uncharacterized lipoprotein YddW (UPF0748 family)